MLVFSATFHFILLERFRKTNCLWYNSSNVKWFIILVCLAALPLPPPQDSCLVQLGKKSQCFLTTALCEINTRMRTEQRDHRTENSWKAKYNKHKFKAEKASSPGSPAGEAMDNCHKKGCGDGQFTIATSTVVCFFHFLDRNFVNDRKSAGGRLRREAFLGVDDLPVWPKTRRRRRDSWNYQQRRSSALHVHSRRALQHACKV